MALQPGLRLFFTQTLVIGRRGCQLYVLSSWKNLFFNPYVIWTGDSQQPIVTGLYLLW